MERRKSFDNSAIVFFFHTTSSQLGGTESKVEEILALTGSLGSRRSTVLIFQKLSMSQGGIKLSAARGNYCRTWKNVGAERKLSRYFSTYTSDLNINMMHLRPGTDHK